MLVKRCRLLFLVLRGVNVYLVVSLAVIVHPLAPCLILAYLPLLEELVTSLMVHSATQFGVFIAPVPSFEKVGLALDVHLLLSSDKLVVLRQFRQLVFRGRAILNHDCLVGEGADVLF